MKKAVVDSGVETATQEEVVEAAEETNDVVQFPEEYREPLRGLLFLGELRDTFWFGGHEFTITTLTEGQLIRVSSLIKEHEGTLAYEVAYRGVVAAACLVEVDGESVYQPLGEGEDLIAKRFEVVKGWYPVVIDKVYEAYMNLEAVSLSVAKSLGEA